MSYNRDFAQKRFYKVFRQNRALTVQDETQDIPFQLKVANHFKAMCDSEIPIVFPNEKITFTRTNKTIPSAYTFSDIEREFDTKKKYYNPINNVCPDYDILLSKGLLQIQSDIHIELENASHAETVFLKACIITIDAILSLAKSYIEEAEKVKNYEVRDLLLQVPANPATSFAEALQSIRFISSMFYLAGNYQLGFGRMDQYLIDYYNEDITKGKLTRLEAKELIKEFFVSLNKDSDLYFGIQQGDNGQSIMLGGVKPDGTCAINELTYIFLEASKELKLIDPKINLRIDRNTPKDLLLLGCELTKVGLGFPQYSNDEVVIPALLKAGYRLEDARNYTVAACWEFIIPGYGLDIVNQGAVSFPYAVNEALQKANLNTIDEQDFEKLVQNSINKQVKNILTDRDLMLLPSPLVSLFFHETILKKRDVTQSARYKNRGIHGAGSANGADALYIIKDLLSKNKRAELIQLKESTIQNFYNTEAQIEHLKNDFPKVGNANPHVDQELKKLFDWFADACDHYSTPDCQIRAGSGSAQFYIWLTDTSNQELVEPTVGATIDGRREEDPFPSSLAPSSGIKVNGLISVLKSFSAIDYSRVVNGGPITIEFSPATLSNKEGLQKLAEVIQYFVELGNQQLQLNVLDYKVLCDAMKHPEKHSNLIVRVWGWSGYFCELAPEFQRQIINRHRYTL